MLGQSPGKDEGRPGRRPSLRRGTTPCGLASHKRSSAASAFLFSSEARRDDRPVATLKVRPDSPKKVLEDQLLLRLGE